MKKALLLALVSTFPFSVQAETYRLGGYIPTDGSGYLQVIACNPAEESVTIAHFVRAGHGGYAVNFAVQTGMRFVEPYRNENQLNVYHVAAVEDCTVTLEPWE